MIKRPLLLLLFTDLNNKQKRRRKKPFEEFHSSFPKKAPEFLGRKTKSSRGRRHKKKRFCRQMFFFFLMGWGDGGVPSFGQLNQRDLILQHSMLAYELTTTQLQYFILNDPLKAEKYIQNVSNGNYQADFRAALRLASPRQWLNRSMKVHQKIAHFLTLSM